MYSNCSLTSYFDPIDNIRRVINSKQQFQGVEAAIFLSIGAWDIPISLQLYPHIARKLPIQINYEETN